MIHFNFEKQKSNSLCPLYLWILGNSHDDSDLSTVYWDCEMKCRRLTKRFLRYGCVHLSTFLPVLISVILDIFHDEFDGSAYNLPFNAVDPFNRESISGWLLAWFYQFNESFGYNIHMITTTTHFACFCYYIAAMCNHFKLMMDSIRLDAQQIQVEKIIEYRHQMWLNAREKLQRAVEFHIDIYE